MKRKLLIIYLFFQFIYPQSIFAGLCVLTAPTPRYLAYLAYQTLFHFIVFLLLFIIIGFILGLIVSKIFSENIPIKSYSLFLISSSIGGFMASKFLYFLLIYFLGFITPLITTIIPSINYDNISKLFSATIGIELLFLKVASLIIASFIVTFIFADPNNWFNRSLSKISVWFLASSISIFVFFVSQGMIEFYSEIIPYIGDKYVCDSSFTALDYFKAFLSI